MLINILSALNGSALPVYLLSELEADPSHVSLLGTPAGNQSDHLLLRSKGTILSTAFCLTAFLRQRNLLLTQEVGVSTSRSYNLGMMLDVKGCRQRSKSKPNYFSTELTMSSSCLAVICSVTLNTVKGSGPGAPYTVTLCCWDACFSSELNS